MQSEEGGGSEGSGSSRGESGGSREGNKEGKGARLCAIVDGDLVLARLEGNHVSDLVVAFDAEEAALVEDYAGDTLSGVHVDGAHGAGSEGPGGVGVLAVLFGVTLVLGASDGLGVADAEGVGVSRLPVVEAGAVNVVPGVL